HRIGGPGRVDVSAGRHIDLGNAQGYVTRGNLDNPYLPEAGAALVLTAGTAAADYAGFAAANMGVADFSDADLAAMRAFIASVAPGMPTGATPETTWAAFGDLPKAERARFLEARRTPVNDVFFTRVAEAAGAVGGGGLDLPAFDATIASLFPVTGVGAGNINVFGSQLKTERGGSIDLFAPGGSIYAGLVSVPRYLATKAASELGIFTIRGGEIRALVHDDVLVNQGRIFTLGGGDITLVSQYRDIDAGRGAKTAAATPPPVLLVDATGEAKLDVSGSIAGSGIATLKTDPALPDANVYPIAPRGVFDAGDAGIRSSGTVNIVAATVLNANNIAASGGLAGAPAAPAAPATAAAPPPGAKPEDVARGAGDRRDPAAQAAASLSVEVVGYGPGAGDATPSEPPARDGKDKDSKS
ncbi:MAG: filamentous hemagglutinin family protein, partial [Rhodocyclaceae bacterium]|nr:filamentous hemagglutinin family protein [Rhodocyclaceae bacterium]